MGTPPIQLGTRVVCVFVTVVVVALTLLPGPLRSVDYLIVGGVGTFVCLLVVFAELARGFTRPQPRRRGAVPDRGV
jgi:hypothetical protein